jgi:hypothetical protein
MVSLFFTIGYVPNALKLLRSTAGVRDVEAAPPPAQAPCSAITVIANTMTTVILFLLILFSLLKI